MLLHLLVHKKLNICHFLLRMSANFKTVWWFFTNLGKPKFDTISFLPDHFIWGLMPYLCTVDAKVKMLHKSILASRQSGKVLNSKLNAILVQITFKQCNGTRKSCWSVTESKIELTFYILRFNGLELLTNCHAPLCTVKSEDYKKEKDNHICQDCISNEVAAFV